ncbi:TetR/AcrR family transcriptional regulator [Sorangium atrum]|uniref:TetR/AcrR family transcriptional regulator n=1 Tax=Sorangium atrum TaxID=2995308 RepID=A0ABT5CDB6_9BACT|nr:TetR/AcrR family transcriptional regulator [Sorangium aterium]MDC0684433.1 TetR/AcrR family transcriptional regulator [Sorangium aterium]
MGYTWRCMSSTGAQKALREGSAQKRSAILAAARELFLADGFDRSSVDAIAARAGVSKRTVYDYFGDKQALLLAVVESTGDLLIAAIRRAIEDTLTHVTDLEDALITFSARIVTEMLGSVDYLALMRLVTMESVQLSQLRGRDHWMMNAPEEAIAERFAEFARAGLLDAPNPRQAADHFIALTVLLAANGFGPVIAPNDARMRELLVEGVRAFLRAYAPSRPAQPRPLA